MVMNPLIMLISAFIPLATGFVWYGPLFGKAWMQETGVTEEKAKQSKMWLTFLLTVVFGFLMSSMLTVICIHQNGFWSSLMTPDGSVNQAGTELNNYATDFMNRFGHNFRTFKHGVLHGVITAVCMAFPVLAINSLFELRSWRYILIHLGYWVVTLAIMGGIICQFS